jgi:hypothetical protein
MHLKFANSKSANKTPTFFSPNFNKSYGASKEPTFMLLKISLNGHKYDFVRMLKAKKLRILIFSD